MVNTKPKVRCVAGRLDWLAASLLTARMYRSALSRWPPPRHMKWRPRHTTSSTSCALSTFVDQSWRCCGGCCIRVAVFVDIVDAAAAAGMLASSTARTARWSPPPLLVVPVFLKWCRCRLLQFLVSVHLPRPCVVTWWRVELVLWRPWLWWLLWWQMCRWGWWQGATAQAASRP